MEAPAEIAKVIERIGHTTSLREKNAVSLLTLDPLGGSGYLPLAFNLSPRSESVLKALIETYLVEGEPVGSRILAKRIPGSFSSATIRNVLADLEDDALLDQPHTSAGRVPTEKAYRYYVDHFVQPIRPDPIQGARLTEAIGGVEGEADVSAFISGGGTR